MTVLYKISEKNAELKTELRYAIEDQMLKFQESGAIQSRGKKILAMLKKTGF